MTRIVLLLFLSCLLAGAPSTAGARPGAPFKTGDTWVYRVTQTAGPRVGTSILTVSYRGLHEYRGAYHHYSDSYRSSSPGVMQRDVSDWTGTYFRQRATILYEHSRQVLEIVFDHPYAFSGAAEQLAGSMEVYERGRFAGNSLWAIAVADAGTTTLTVPAGTFTAKKWKGTLRIGRLEKDYIVYTVGSLEIRTEIEVRRDGELIDRMRLELERGPIPKR